MEKNIKNAPKMGFFPHLRPPKMFFQKSGSVTFVPLRCTNFMQKLEKNNEQSLRYFKTDQPTDQPTDKGDHWGPPRENPGSNMTKEIIAYNEPKILIKYFYITVINLSKYNVCKTNI